MYKLSIGSLLVVLVTLQQHNTAAAMSLTEQFEQLIRVLDLDGNEQKIDEQSEVTISYSQLNDFLTTIAHHKECRYNKACQDLVSQLLKIKEVNQEPGFDQEVAFTFQKWYPLGVTMRHYQNPLLVHLSGVSSDIDNRIEINALNCILLI